MTTGMMQTQLVDNYNGLRTVIQILVSNTSTIKCPIDISLECLNQSQSITLWNVWVHHSGEQPPHALTQHLAEGYLLQGPTSQGLNPVHTNCLAPGGHPYGMIFGGLLSNVLSKLIPPKGRANVPAIIAASILC